MTLQKTYKKSGLSVQQARGKTFVLAIILALLFCAIPWEEFRIIEFSDRERYAASLVEQRGRLEYLEITSVSQIFTSEILWHYSVREILYWFELLPNELFLGISFISTFSIFYFVIANANSSAYLLLLLNPLFIDLCFSQFRFSLSLVLWMWALKFSSRVPKATFCLLAFSIHTAILILLIINTVVSVLDSRNFRKMCTRRFLNISETKIVISVLVFTVLMLSFALGPFRVIILEYFGDRRASYGGLGSSVLFTSYWIVCGLVLLFLKIKSPKQKNLMYFTVLALVGCLSGFLDGSTTRLLAASLPFFAVSISKLQKTKLKTSLIFGYICYSLVHWKYWSIL